MAGGIYASRKTFTQTPIPTQILAALTTNCPPATRMALLRPCSLSRRYPSRFILWRVRGVLPAVSELDSPAAVHADHLDRSQTKNNWRCLSAGAPVGFIKLLRIRKEALQRACFLVQLAQCVMWHDRRLAGLERQHRNRSIIYTFQKQNEYFKRLQNMFVPLINVGA